MPDELFVPTEKYLLTRYANCKELVRFYRVLDDLYIKKAYETIILKHAIYDQYRHDLATKDTFDENREWTYSNTHGLPYPWPVWEGGISDKYPNKDKWSQKRIYLHVLVDQMLALPYTLENFQRFVAEVERELHYYNDDIPWIKVGFKTGGAPPLKKQNVLYISVRRDAAESGYDPVMYQDSLNVIEELCRRICPCNISIRRKEMDL